MADKMNDKKKASLFGYNLLRLRKAAKLNQDDLAAKSGVHRVTISKLETGAHEGPEPKTVKALAEALGCKEGDLYREQPTVPGPVSDPADTMPLDIFLERQRGDITDRERRLLEGVRNRPGSGITGTEADWLALLDFIRKEYSPKSSS
jgi:transcriptional regulator with XRE-family HTH domain